MKSLNTLFILSCMIFLTACSCNDACVEADENGVIINITSDPRLEDGTKSKKYIHYEVLDDSVIYHYIYRSGVSYYMDKEAIFFEVIGADPKTFSEMIHKYAKDVNTVYHKGKPLKHRDPATFKIIDTLVSADKYGVYLDNKLIKNSHTQSFKFISRNYAIDNNQVYYMGRNFYKLVQGVDVNTFTVLDDEYTKDKDNVYYQDTKINNVRAEHFEILKYGYSKDDKNIFLRSTILKQADYNSFFVLSYEETGNHEHNAGDKNNFYSSTHNGYEQLIIIKKEK